MRPTALWPFQSPSIHEQVASVIRRHSTNSTDVRAIALGDLDLSGVTRVLDLGCGFGFMTEAVASRVSTDAEFVGVDVWPSNRAPFLKRVADAGRRGRFVCARLDVKLPYADGSFDLVICCYSLYFFVEVLPEVARVLSPKGRFVAITHSERSLAGQLPAAGFAEATDELLALAHRFSAENGEALLRPWFEDVIRIDYRNDLVFEPEDIEDLLAYLRFKLPIMSPGTRPGDDLPDQLERFIRQEMAKRGRYVLEKNDAAFRCRQPSWH